MKTVMVTGVGGPAGKNVSEMLIQHGFRVVGVDMQPVELDNLVFYRVPAVLDEQYLDQMFTVARREKPDLIIPTVTEELPILAGHWKWMAEFPVLISPVEGVVVANDKYLTSQSLSVRGVSVPRFILPSQAIMPRDVEDNIGWPCISKPRVGRGGRGVAIREKEDFQALSQLSDEFILQEFADGVDYAPNVYLGREGGSTAVVLEKTELKEGRVGNARSVRRVEAADVEALAIAAAKALGLLGPVDVDIRRRQDGQPVVLEVNARFGANIYHAPEVFERVIEDYLSA
jgi:carbamoylphosphate synthase large subunit